MVLYELTAASIKRSMFCLPIVAIMFICVEEYINKYYVFVLIIYIHTVLIMVN